MPFFPKEPISEEDWNDAEGWDPDPKMPYLDALYRYRTDAEGNKIPIHKDGRDIRPLHMFGGSMDMRPTPPPPPPNETVRGFNCRWLAAPWREFWDWCFKPAAAACVMAGAIWLVGCL